MNGDGLQALSHDYTQTTSEHVLFVWFLSLQWSIFCLEKPPSSTNKHLQDLFPWLQVQLPEGTPTAERAIVPGGAMVGASFRLQPEVPLPPGFQVISLQLEPDLVQVELEGVEEAFGELWPSTTRVWVVRVTTRHQAATMEAVAVGEPWETNEDQLLEGQLPETVVRISLPPIAPPTPLISCIIEELEWVCLVACILVYIRTEQNLLLPSLFPLFSSTGPTILTRHCTCNCLWVTLHLLLYSVD